MNGQSQKQPELSVVVFTVDNFESIRSLVRTIAAQSGRERMELVLVCPSEEELGLDPDAITGFADVQVIDIGPFNTVHAPRVAGVRHATAPVVVFTEDHCFPGPGWAEALLEAHQGPWAAVGPIIGLANPRHHRAWASYFIQYGHWAFSTADAGGEQDDVAGHNSSYKRDVLLAYGGDLDKLMVFESVLHEDLRARGHRLYVEPRARAYHAFITKLKPYTVEYYAMGRRFAATRLQRWSLARRLLYLLGSPLIPFVRMARILPMIRRFGWQRELMPGVLPSLFLGLVASGFGEMMGYALGVGNTEKTSLDLHVRRWRYVLGADREDLWSGRAVHFSPDPPRPGQPAVL